MGQDRSIRFRVGQVRVGHSGSRMVRPGQGRSGQVRTGQDRSGQVRICEKSIETFEIDCNFKVLFDFALICLTLI